MKNDILNLPIAMHNYVKPKYTCLSVGLGKILAVFII